MNKANVNDRASVERIYGPDAWEQDASRNSRGNATVVYGLKILSGPDADGAFALARTSQHVGEGDREGDAVFLAAFDADAAATASDEGTYGGFGGPSRTPTTPAITGVSSTMFWKPRARRISSRRSARATTG